MSSYQNAAPGAKSLKFANALDPFAGFLGRDQQQQQQDTVEVEPTLTEQLDSRLRLSTNPISMTPQLQKQVVVSQQQHHQALQHQPVQQQQQQPSPADNGSSNETETGQCTKKDSNNNEEEDDDDDDSDFGSDYEDDDAALQAFRQKRLAELKREHQQAAEHSANGHGQVRIISQDEFLPECTSSNYVVVHFFHKEFARCQIMSHHLKRLAPAHWKCKFVEIDAEKAPFFVAKLKVQTLPTLIVFKDGKAVDRLVGFEDFSNDSKNPDEFPTSQLGYWLEKSGAIEYDGPGSDEEQDNKASTGGRRTIGGLSQYAVYDEDV
ncbi:thioredoxin [Nitzschia inconspicua]|uniref:Thioredoxin n=1 Tax=Nitzschia inconspicua TaxID=303405 RepID=A0A9K3PV77_9STRA|nr:thioredoxin [Nitzschia inconspicua]